MLRRSFVFALAIVATSAGFVGHSANAEGRLTLFAAASLKGSLDRIAEMYREKTGTEVNISFAASSALAKQIEAGAPADIFISADIKWMDYLVDRGAVPKDAAFQLLANRLVLVAQKDAEISLKIGKHFPLAATLGEEKLAMGETRGVPAGIYGRQALEYYGVWKDVEAKVAGAENVRAALKLVARGEAPLGIVYETDAKAEPGVKVVGVFGEESHEPIVYPAAPVAASADKDGTKAFLGFLRGPEATAVFREAGFTTFADS